MNTDYINSANYKDLEKRIKDLVAVMTERTSMVTANRRLRYVEIDIEGERKAGRIAADELYIPQHLIDTNIKREQPSYVQYVTQSPRAVILSDTTQPANDPQVLEKDVTNRLRYNGWQTPLYANIDGMQQNGYGIMEIVYDESKSGHVAHEFVQFGDFGFIMDTRDIQETEMVSRSYFFSRTKLKSLSEDEESGWSAAQIQKIIDGEPMTGASDAVIDNKDKSLFKVDKVMFRIGGIVHVGWTCTERCDDWLCVPRPLFIGRRAPYSQQEMQQMAQQAALTGQQLDQKVLAIGKQAFETDYPYVLFPYLISENNTISQLKGRVYMDQDAQEGASSLMSSFCTAHRRASGMYFSLDTDDPNSSITLQKNVYFEQGALINKKIKQFQLSAPDAEVMNAIMTIVSANQNETSQVNFAAQNRKDSRKTATEVSAATQSAANLSTVQVVLFASALRQLYGTMFEIIQSRVIAGLITDVTPELKALYGRRWLVKPSGDVDVIERQQLLQAMMQAWPVIQQTAAAVPFLCDMLTKAFPDSASKYVQFIQQQQQQQQSAQAQQQNALMQQAMGVAKGVMSLAQHKEFFSEVGRIHALPAVEQLAEQLKQIMPKQ